MWINWKLVGHKFILIPWSVSLDIFLFLKLYMTFFLCYNLETFFLWHNCLFVGFVLQRHCGSTFWVGIGVRESKVGQGYKFVCKFLKKVGWGNSGVYRWKFRENKRLKGFFSFLFSWICFLLWGFNGYKKWIIQLDWKNYKL
jgi:hypothetical protein